MLKLNKCLTLKGQVTSMDFSPDSTKIVVTLDDNKAQVFNVSTGEELSYLDVQEYVTRVRFSPDNAIIATLSEKGISLWDTRTGNRLFNYEMERHPCLADIAFNYDGTQCAVACLCHLVIVSINRSDYMQSTVTRKTYDKLIHSIYYSSDGTKIVLVAFENMEVTIIDSRTVETIHEICGGIRGSIYSASLSPDNTELVMIFRGKLKLLNLYTGNQRYKRVKRNGLPITQGYCRKVMFHPNGKWILALREYDVVAIYEILTGELLYSFKLNESYVWDIKISPDGTQCVTATWNNQVNLWQIMDN